jgi:hypothetical protein
MAGALTWEQWTINTWRLRVDHYHTAHVTVSYAAFVRRRRVYAVSYGVQQVASAYTLRNAKAAAIAYAKQEGWHA